jgi:hypothetical protein
VAPSQSGSFYSCVGGNAKHFRGGEVARSGDGLVRFGGDPSGAKARILWAFGGTAEAVPFPNALAARLAVAFHETGSGPMRLGRWTAEGGCPHMTRVAAAEIPTSPEAVSREERGERQYIIFRQSCCRGRFSTRRSSMTKSWRPRRWATERWMPQSLPRRRSPLERWKSCGGLEVER